MIGASLARRRHAAAHPAARRRTAQRTGKVRIRVATDAEATLRGRQSHVGGRSQHAPCPHTTRQFPVPFARASLLGPRLARMANSLAWRTGGVGGKAAGTQVWQRLSAAQRKWPDVRLGMAVKEMQ